MKNILFVMVLFLSGLSGCVNYKRPTNIHIISIRIDRSENNQAKYGIKLDHGEGFQKEFTYFIDTIGKFNVGDTLILVKKQTKK